MLFIAEPSVDGVSVYPGVKSVLSCRLCGCGACALRTEHGTLSTRRCWVPASSGTHQAVSTLFHTRCRRHTHCVSKKYATRCLIITLAMSVSQSVERLTGHGS